jgi:hypothetical protein
MIKKFIFLLSFFFFLCNSTLILAKEDETECKTNATNCPALPGECVQYEGEWIGTWVEAEVETFWRCDYANIACTSTSDCLAVWDTTNPYNADIIQNEDCIPIDTTLTGGYCDSEYWTTCCNLTDVPATPTPTATPTANPGDPTATPTPTPRNISGSFYLYEDAGVTGDFCGGQTSTEPVSISGAYLSLISGADVRDYVLPTASDFDIDTTSLPSGQTWDIRLTLSSSLAAEDLMVCACPSATDANNPYRCSYFSISDDEIGVDFYLKPYNETDAWFQTFGGNVFARTSISSIVPVTSCLSSGTCTANLIASINSNSLSSGFSLLSTSDNSSILTSDGLNQSRDYINSSDRNTNQNSYATNSQISQYDYDYYYKKLAGDVNFNLTNTSIDLDTLRADAAWQSGTTIIRTAGDLNLNDSQNWAVTSGENVIVLVNGTLNISDNSPEGGFLAFIVNGNIVIYPSVGHYIDPSSPTVVSVTNSNANLEGLFMADGILQIQAQSVTTIPDYKFIGAGTFIGWGGVDLNRDFDDGNTGKALNSMQATENFIFRPDFLQNFPEELKVINSNWRELSPQKIGE